MKPKFGDPEIIEKHHILNRIALSIDDSIEGIIHHYGEYGKDIEFECLICNEVRTISLKGENSKTKCCGIVYNKKFKYGRRIYLEVDNKQS